MSRHLEDLLAFHAVAETGSFTQAAEGLGSSKGAISKQVQRLEAHLGIQLFRRSTRSVSLTEEGKELFGFSRRILELSDEAGRKLKDLQAGEGGVIRISTPVSIGEAFFPSFIQEMRRVLPKVVFEADLANEHRDILGGEIDFAIRSVDEHEPDLVARYLGKLKDVICASPALAKRLRSEDPRDLARHSCILSSLDPGWNLWTLASKKEEVRVQVSGTLATNQYGLAAQYAVAGYGVARLPLYWVRKDLESGRLVQLYPAFQIATHSMYLVYAKGRYASKRHKEVRDGILAWFAARKEIFV